MQYTGFLERLKTMCVSGPHPSSQHTVQGRETVPVPEANVPLSDDPMGPPPLPVGLANAFAIAPGGSLVDWKKFSQAQAPVIRAVDFEGKSVEAVSAAMLESLEWLAGSPPDTATFIIPEHLRPVVTQAIVAPHVHTFVSEGSYTVYVTACFHCVHPLMTSTAGQTYTICPGVMESRKLSSSKPLTWHSAKKTTGLSTANSAHRCSVEFLLKRAANIGVPPGCSQGFI
jgi:hypothetical protein